MVTLFGVVRVNRRLFATLRPVQRAVEEMALEVCGTWQMGGVKRVRIGGDGAAWVRELAEQFPFAEISYHPAVAGGVGRRV